MPEMPYVWAKGKILSALDARYSSMAAAERLGVLNQLRNQASPNDPASATLGGSLNGPRWPAYYPGGADISVRLKSHVNADWFGLRIDVATGEPEARTAAGRKYDPGAGWWNSWKGGASDVSEPWAVFRLALIRAIEVSLGMRADGPIPAPGDIANPLPIEFFWVCGEALFEAYVNWTNRGGNGRVTVVIHTPGWSEPKYKQRDASLPPTTEYELRGPIYGAGIAQPVAGQPFGIEGMIIIGHDMTVPGSAETIGDVKEGFMRWAAQGVGPQFALWDTTAGNEGPYF